jgi:predicted DNA-binding protein (MmcQ/YjbR family)
MARGLDPRRVSRRRVLRDVSVPARAQPSSVSIAFMARSKVRDDVANKLREIGLARYPGAHLKSPWPGHLDLAVKDKTFAYLSVDGEPFSISVKLPLSSAAALILPFTEPTPYGLGKSGWVSAKFPDGEPPPMDLLLAWIEESYRAQAPKKLLAELDGAAVEERRPAAKKAATKKAVTKKAVPRR